ncbi:UNVERIFIED_CONTAM: hypothetical protein GTU68_007655 [Idotea baltica]|nr:hypothetical protein [Idotea baltica]
MSPKSSPFKSPCEGRKGRSFASLKKKSCDEDEFLMEFICGEEGAKEDSTSSAFSSLLSAPIQSCQASSSVLSSNGPRLPIRRCLSMVDTSTPVSSRVKSLEKNMDILKEASSPCFLISSFKRPQSPSASPDAKRRKEESGEKPAAVTKSSNHGATAKLQGSPKVSLSQRQLSDPEPTSKDLCRPKIQRCHSESHVSIMKALNNASNNNGNLTGDFTQPLSLPVISGGKHPDLKSIDIHTMSALMQGAFRDKVASFKILDCRYPYEYEGGHITSAVNWHYPKNVEEYLNSLDKPPKLTGVEAPRHILIFHCEFSAERGPRTQRMLREMDRTMNKEHYPALHFPELYLLEGGYKAFYEIYPEHCSPVDYVKMLDENHSEDFKFFRSKSKSWAAENRQSRCPVPRTGPKRLGL